MGKHPMMKVGEDWAVVLLILCIVTLALRFGEWLLTR
jgi:hypothetical protein